MNSIIFVALFVGLASAYPYSHHEDGQYKGEGLAESQDHGQYNNNGYGNAYGYDAYSYGHNDDGQYHGEGEAESQDNGHYNNYDGQYNQYNGYNGYNSHDDGHDGQYRGEGLAESQDNGHYNSYAQGYSHGHYAHGAAPLGHDGRVVDTPEVAHAKAAHFAAVAHASSGAHYSAPAHYAGASNYAAPAYYSAPSSYAHGSAHYAHGAAPLGHDGRVVDTPEVAHAKAAHFAAVSHASQGSYGHHY